MDRGNTLSLVTVSSLLLCIDGNRFCPVPIPKLERNLITGLLLSVISGASNLLTLEQPKLKNRILETWPRM